MASGLDNLFTTYGNEYGAAGAFQAGQKRGLADQTTRLANDQRSAELARYSAQTPDSNRLLAAQARSGELGNMQGEADAQAGVHGAVAGKTAAQARLEAQKAQEAFKQLPLEVQQQYHTKISQANVAMLTNLETVLSQTGNIGQAIQIIESEYPNVAKDQGWNAAKSKYGNVPVEQALNDIRQWKAKFASSQAYGNPEFQGQMIKQDAALSSAERQQQIQANATLGAARERATSAPTKPTTPQFIKEQFRAMFPNETDAQIAERALLYMKATESAKEGGIVPELNQTQRRLPGGMEGRTPAGTGSTVIKLD